MARLLWLYADQYGCGAYRCGIPSRSLEDRLLHENHLICSEDSLDALPLERIDAVVFQRPIDSSLTDLMKECRRRRIAVLLEMDDLLFAVPRHNPAHPVWAPKRIQNTLRRQLDFSDAVLVSSAPLAEEVVSAMGWKSREKLYVCPNHLHPMAWGDRIFEGIPVPRRPFVTIGWQGSFSHDADFMGAREALTRLLREHSSLRLVLFGSIPLQLKKIFEGFAFQVSYVAGVPFASYPQHLRALGFDIGIAPLENSRFNRCKSNIKWLEYSALGIPCVASRIAPYSSSITDGETGFLATGEDEWYERLQRLVVSGDERRRIGEAARASAWSRWSDATCHQAWMGAFAYALDAARRRA